MFHKAGAWSTNYLPIVSQRTETFLESLNIFDKDIKFVSEYNNWLWTILDFACKNRLKNLWCFSDSYIIFMGGLGDCNLRFYMGSRHVFLELTLLMHRFFGHNKTRCESKTVKRHFNHLQRTALNVCHWGL